jgi:hypothetical protein
MSFFLKYERCTYLKQVMPWLLLAILLVPFAAVPQNEQLQRPRGELSLAAATDYTSLFIASQKAKHEEKYSLLQQDAITEGCEPFRTDWRTGKEPVPASRRTPLFILRLLYTQTTSSCL